MGNRKTDAELQQEATILADQANRFVEQFAADVSHAERFTTGSSAFRTAANAYERIALGEDRFPARLAQSDKH